MVYDYANRLTSVNSTALGDFVYQYDDLDNLRQLTRSGITYTYQYDDTGSRRLQKMHLAGQPSAEVLGYLYDSRGNVTQRRPGGFNRQAHDFIVDKANRTTQLRAIGSSQPLETHLYDGNGRRVQITDANSTRVQIYNQAGQFVYETSTPIASSTCSSATPPNLIFCSGFEAQQGGGNATSTRHIHLAGKQIARTSITSGNGNPNSTTTFVHTDLLGSVVAESTQAPPQITHRPLHEPFGAPSTGTYLQGPDYTGHVTDSTSGLSYMQARYYDPLAGRFLGVDPVGVDLASGGNFNRYWYANNNPYKYIDPDGRVACTGTRIGNCGAGGLAMSSSGSSHVYISEQQKQARRHRQDQQAAERRMHASVRFNRNTAIAWHGIRNAYAATVVHRIERATGITDTSNRGSNSDYSGPVQPYAAVSLRGGLGASLSVDIVQSPGKTSIFVGVGPGVGLSANLHAGVGAGSAEGATVKASATGGFGGVARGSWTMYGDGPGNAFKAGYGAGSGASATLAAGWTWVFENDPRR